MISCKSDIQQMYTQDEYQVDNIETTEQNIYTFDISFQNECITDIVEREYNGSIAYHRQLAISKPHRHKGHCKRILHLECGYYISTGIKEVRLSAARDGIIVWLKLGFSIYEYDIKKFEKEILKYFRDYLITVIYPEDLKSVRNLMNRCKTLNILLSKSMKEYLLPRDKISFSDFLEKGNKIIGTIKMKKELSNEKTMV